MTECVMSTHDATASTVSGAIEVGAQSHSSSTAAANDNSQQNGGAASGDGPGRWWAGVGSPRLPRKDGRYFEVYATVFIMRYVHFVDIWVHEIKVPAIPCVKRPLWSNVSCALGVLVAVPVQCEPQLRQGHRIHIYFDVCGIATPISFSYLQTPYCIHLRPKYGQRRQLSLSLAAAEGEPRGKERDRHVASGKSQKDGPAVTEAASETPRFRRSDYNAQEFAAARRASERVILNLR